MVEESLLKSTQREEHEITFSKTIHHVVLSHFHNNFYKYIKRNIYKYIYIFIDYIDPAFAKIVHASL